MKKSKGISGLHWVKSKGISALYRIKSKGIKMSGSPDLDEGHSYSITCLKTKASFIEKHHCLNFWLYTLVISTSALACPRGQQGRREGPDSVRRQGSFF